MICTLKLDNPVISAILLTRKKSDFLFGKNTADGKEKENITPKNLVFLRPMTFGPRECYFIYFHWLYLQVLEISGPDFFFKTWTNCILGLLTAVGNQISRDIWLLRCLCMIHWASQGFKRVCVKRESKAHSESVFQPWDQKATAAPRVITMVESEALRMIG